MVTTEDLEGGFAFEGERVRFWNPRKGIWRPRQLGSGPALSVMTAPPRAGREPPYDDQVGSDADWFVYQYEGTEPDLWTNAAVRQAMLLRRPIIYLYGISAGHYLPIFPVTVVRDDPAELSFHLMVETEARDPVAALQDAPGVTPQRAYATVAVKKRLHQQRFRELVVSAYQVTCAMCRLRHGELLDAAHILEDRDERGRAEVPNGLCLCKIHHAAYDADIVGVDPDYRVHVRRDVLEEQDGPMLQHGLQAMQDVRIRLPRSAAQRPRREYLEERFGRFRAA